MDETPAWMIAEDIMSGIQSELMQEALDLLRQEIDSGRIKVDGSFAASSELTGETERDLFLMDKLLADEANLRLRYENLVKAVEDGSEKNPEIVARLEEVKKFLLVVSQISMTVGYAKIFGAWISDAGSHMKESDPVAIICSTALPDPRRKEALEFILSNKAFLESAPLDHERMEILKSAYKRLGG